MVQMELVFQQKRDQVRRQLLAQADFTKEKAFRQLSKGMESISLDTLCAFLNKNGFQPTRKDIEAILRRCDHDCN